MDIYHSWVLSTLLGKNYTFKSIVERLRSAMCMCTGLHGYKGNHQNYSRIMSSVSVITRLLHVLITCGAASTSQYKRVACKKKLVRWWVQICLTRSLYKIFKFICMYLGCVYELKRSQTDIKKNTRLFYKLWKSRQIKYKKRVRVHVRIVHVHVLVHVADLNLSSIYVKSCHLI